jgi:hypothetical protein
MSRHKVRSSPWFQICSSIGGGWDWVGVALYPAIMFPRSFNCISNGFLTLARGKDRCLQILDNGVTEKPYFSVANLLQSLVMPLQGTDPNSNSRQACFTRR